MQAISITTPSLGSHQATPLGFPGRLNVLLRASEKAESISMALCPGVWLLSFLTIFSPPLTSWGDL